MEERPTTTESARLWLDEARRRFEAHLARRLAAGSPVAPRLEEAMSYALLGGGKRLRPLLVYATGHALGVPLEILDPAACAVECIHGYSLVHDDLPAMDDDDVRRGRPSCHRAFDEATAILVGDALQSLAFEILAEDPGPSDAARLAMIRTLTRAAGRRGLVGGQSLDLALATLPKAEVNASLLRRINRHKTGLLIAASVLLGAAPAGAEGQRTVLERLGDDLGLAFQIWDDVLDARAETNVSAGSSDAIPTLADLLGIEGAEAEVRRLEADALDAVRNLGGRSAPLAALVHEMLRHHA
jgi:geranylgeranyl pyrophosphate synthase